MKQIKYSSKREALMEILHSTRSHPDADWLYSKMKDRFPNISLGTVYRNLSFLVDEGHILKLSVGSGAEHYDGNPKTHSHLICKTCGSIIDLDDVIIDDMYSGIEHQYHVRIDNHSLLFEGLCPKCNEV